MTKKTSNLKNFLTHSILGLAIGSSVGFTASYYGFSASETTSDESNLDELPFSSHAVTFDSQVPDVMIKLSKGSAFETYSITNVDTKQLKENCRDGFYIEYKLDSDAKLTCYTNYLSSVNTISVTIPKEESASSKLEHRLFVSGYGFSETEWSMGTISIPSSIGKEEEVLIGVESPEGKVVTFQDTVTRSDLAEFINLDTARFSEKLKQELNIESLHNTYRNNASTWI